MLSRKICLKCIEERRPNVSLFEKWHSRLFKLNVVECPAKYYSYDVVAVDLEDPPEECAYELEHKILVHTLGEKIRRLIRKVIGYVVYFLHRLFPISFLIGIIISVAVVIVMNPPRFETSSDIKAEQNFKIEQLQLRIQLLQIQIDYLERKKQNAIVDRK